MKKLKFFGIFLLFILFVYCVPKVEGNTDDETEVNEENSQVEGNTDDEPEANQVINEAGEGSGTQEGGNNRKWKSATNRRTVKRRERKQKLKEAITASQGGKTHFLRIILFKNLNIWGFKRADFPYFPYVVYMGVSVI
ncbi:unnamed protein product [Meloidogyne enterolobii]|uniref:Uncharacterized protein n=1 Tax=Meloidogyne enterolobii TaxID=390850 RepID=A0ACB0ZJS0_MELEN